MLICVECEGSLHMNDLLRESSNCSIGLDALFTRDPVQDYIYILLKTIFKDSSCQSSIKDQDSQDTFSTDSKTEYHLHLDDKELTLTFKFLNAILSNGSMIPYGVRWILKQLNFLFKRNDSYLEFNGAERNLCRFYFGCLAKGMRHPFQLMEWNKHVQENIIQVSKALEYLSQPEAFEVNKELDLWMEKHEQVCCDFIKNTYSVSDFYKDLQIQQIASLTMDEEIDISLSDLWFIHTLVADYYQPCMESNDSDYFHIPKFLSEITSTPLMTRLPGKMIRIPLFHRWNHGFLPCQPSFLFQDAFNSKELLYMDVKSCLVELFGCLENGYELALKWKVDVAIEAALASSFPLLSQLGSLSRSLLNDLSRFSELDIYKPLAVLHQEVCMELKIQGNYKIKLQTEIKDLSLKKNSMQSHYTYLQMQLEAFQVALINTRNRFQFTKKKLAVPISRISKEDWITRIPMDKHNLETDPEYDENLLLLISSPSTGCIQITLTDKNYGEPNLDFTFTLDDLLETKMYEIHHLKIECLSISIESLLAKLLIC